MEEKISKYPDMKVSPIGTMSMGLAITLIRGTNTGGTGRNATVVTNRGCLMMMVGSLVGRVGVEPTTLGLKILHVLFPGVHYRPSCALDTARQSAFVPGSSRAFAQVAD